MNESGSPRTWVIYKDIKPHGSQLAEHDQNYCGLIILAVYQTNSISSNMNKEFRNADIHEACAD